MRDLSGLPTILTPGDQTVRVRSLIMLRHGKSDWSAEYGDDDRARPLARRGEKSARTVGQLIARSGSVPDVALTSPAVRASRTLRLAMEAGRWECPVRVREGLYGDAASVLDEVRAEPPTTGILMVVGHEPAWSELARLLIGGGDLRVPTASLVRIELDVAAWSDVGPGSGELSWLVPGRLVADLSAAQKRATRRA